MSPLTHELVSAKTKGKPIDEIKKLNCWASNLTDISLLKDIKNLEVLTLSVNKISTLRDIQYCTNLKELYIRDNRISKIEEIFYLKNLKNLKILWLADNECSKDHLYDSEYRLTVIRNLPNLQKLDNSNVTLDEIETAMKHGKLVESAPVDDTQSNSEFTGVSDNYEYIMPVNGEEVPVAERKSTSSSFERKLQEVSQICDEEEECEDNGEESSSGDEEISNRTIDIEIRAETNGKETRAESSGSNCSFNNQFGTQSQSSNAMQAVLLLINDLNEMQLQTVMDACETRKLNIRDPIIE